MAGSPHARFVWLSDDKTKLYYAASKQRPSDLASARFIEFSTVTAAARGHTTAVFTRTGKRMYS